MAKRVIISGGGTGGHIFPAIAIANALKSIDSNTEILFVGANGKMEMEKVPAAGYEIVGLDIQGFQRSNLLKNILLPIKIVKSVLKALSIIKKFKPDVVVGVGGYASGPLLYAASLKRLPILIQEQNSFAGVTNKFLGKSAKRICVAFDNMDAFFTASKIIKTGNPVRKDTINIEGKREEAIRFFELDPEKKTVLVIGGSLGARTLNDSMTSGIESFRNEDIQVIWQTGKFYYRTIIDRFGNQPKDSGIRILEFLNRMDLAYAAADLIVSRAGAGTISELCLVKKPVILVPSPNVAEDHQTKNAMALVNVRAAVLVADRHAEAELVDQTIKLLKDDVEMKALSENIAALGLPNADEIIAKEVLSIARNG
ncbi:UDP-N-acetylglucosamine--N-acetylmuramyl-(pentapeptide) pyrophosphoryl-undecaprenol N-acetylglucosamine transferase [Pseudopedobacter saltans DSM 12145]|uniref:UDP-N-acetylglucosamine--N-acetylmuramyl-(pentapeptide) pyrophosphoryl-undecaprenol N-acetylglucosamine transferase n=1 Tax=Pseudopedobacter saltans (strain ATCC 51119 / DSM 12145 / JCM 21818 / CCUG 39354 / LMG 10337 / NBRC 100064 / NCIMB 13643) TaxID=762903 RepID=F0SCY1_PSESL|nr:undecaprenyldiphospho-muramoylpentapeptide beta-N-acetylglucosaminyltransferase [Pseudopedobacter saltans]ADY50720.1 UDP-N-acetylglucosamine--N-acetylmuramyl-(pentapeptide) pyrophosphoryl-undecaprenol N-acetylglucosamine transferase [Pseudopedobacter saltans DSM 12145]